MKKLGYLSLLLFLFLSLSGFSQDEYVVPLKGEGIHALLRRTNRDGKDYLQKFIDLNSGKLGKGNSLKLGVSYRLPPLGKASKKKETKKEPLFGKKYAEYTIESDRLKGACFFLSSGHGGPDPGATYDINVNNKLFEIHEDEYAYDVTLRLALNLLKEGATVHIIIQDPKDGIRDEQYLNSSKNETCMGSKIPLDQNDRLKQRSDKINQLSKKSKIKYQRSLFIHWDSRISKERVDVFFCYWRNSSTSKEYASVLKETISEKYKQNQVDRSYIGTIKPEGFHVLGSTKPIGVLIELGNICNNGRDRQRLLNYKNRQSIANWLCEGTIKDYENSKNVKKP